MIPERRRRPVERAVRLADPVPDTSVAPDLQALCASGERAVTVFVRRGHGGTACLGSPFDAEAFVAWRTAGLYVFLRGDLPEQLALWLDDTARVAVKATYEGNDMQTAGEQLDFEVNGVAFVLRVFDDPSGLRGQVFRGDEKVAGVQIYHREDREALLAEARKDRAVRRAAARFTAG